MKWWAFNAEQLSAALADFIEREKREGYLCHNESSADKLAEAICDFLHSPEASAHKLIGGQ